MRAGGRFRGPRNLPYTVLSGAICQFTRAIKGGRSGIDQRQHAGVGRGVDACQFRGSLNVKNPPVAIHQSAKACGRGVGYCVGDKTHDDSSPKESRISKAPQG